MSDHIFTQYSNYETAAANLAKAAVVAEVINADIISNSASNLANENWIGDGQQSFDHVKNEIVQANNELVAVIQKTSGKLVQAMTMIRGGQAVAASMFQ